MSEFVSGTNPILEIAEEVLSSYPYVKEIHPTFGVAWYRRGGQFSIPDDNRQFFAVESANRKGFRSKRYLPFDLSAGFAEPEVGGWLTEEFRYSPESNGLIVTHSMAPGGETWEEFRVRQKQLRIETFFDPNSEATIAERQKFIDLLQLIGEKGIFLSQND